MPATVLGAETRGLSNITSSKNSVDTVGINGKTTSGDGVRDNGLDGVVAQALALRVVVRVCSTKSDRSSDTVTRVIVVSLFDVPPGSRANTADEGVDDGLLGSSPSTVENGVDWREQQSLSNNKI